MSFASPLFLGLALGVLVVVLLHTLHRQRRSVGSVMLWRQLELDTRPRRSLRLPKPNLLLLLQVLAVLLLVLALAQPRWGDGDRAPVQHVFILDVSASMGTTDAEGSRFDAAREALLADLDRLTLTEGDALTVVTAGTTPRLLAVRHVETSAARALVASLSVTGGSADWRATGALLPAILGSDLKDDLGDDLDDGPGGDGGTRITVLTDDAEGAALVAPALSPRIVSFGNAETPNAAVTARIVPATQTPGAPPRWRLEGEVALQGLAEPPALAMGFRPEGRATFLDWEAPAYGARQGDVIPFEALLELPGPGILELALPGDAASHDDRFLLFVPDAAARLRVLYVGPGNPALQAALLTSGRAEVFAATALPADLGLYDLVVLDNAVVPERPPGNLLWLGSARVEDEPTPTLRPAVANDWDREHALARNLDWAGLAQVRIFDGAAWPDTRVIAAADGTPLVQARSRPDGREVRLALDPTDPAWTGAPQFPILIGNILDWLDGTRGGCIAGQVCPLPASDLGAAVTDPDGAPLARPAEGVAGILPETLAAGFVPERAGLHTVGGVAYPVNADPAESVAAVPAPASDARDEDRPAWPPYRWILAAALVLIVVEAVVALFRSEARLALSGNRREAGRQRTALALRAGTLALGLAAFADAPFPQLRPAEQIVVIAPAQETEGAGARLISTVRTGCDGIFTKAAGLVTTGTPPRVAQDLSCEGGGPRGAAAADGAGSDLGLALELALAMMQPGASGRIVLAGDAPQTGAAPLRGAEALVRADVRLDLLPLGGRAPGDAWVADVALPETLYAGDTAPLTAIIHSDTATTARIEVGQDERDLLSREVALVAGANRIDTTVSELSEGPARFWVRITAADDPQPLNDRNEVLRDVGPAPRVAIVTPEADRGDIMADALAVQGLEATVLRPDRAPFKLADWLDYDGVVLMNVPSLDLDTRQQEQLGEFAGIHGRGLMILGGENSFGPGGYFRTPLEAISPLSAKIPREAPVAAIAFVLDRSGSMQAPVEGVTRLDIAKEATLSAIDLLNAESQVAVVVFDSEPHVVVPLQERRDLGAAERALAPVTPGGGTSIAPGLEAALEELDRAEAPIRHVVVMSDGLTQPGDFDGLMERAMTEGITVSTVSIGNGADVGRLADLARKGGGSSHVTRDFRALPGILSQEAMMLGGEPMEQGPEAAAWDDRSAPWLSGLPQMPAVDAWVRTSLKAGARQHLALTDAEGDVVPILASWRYGNGTVLALASHGVGPGTARWQMQSFFPLIYAQAMRAMLSGGERELSLDIRRLGDTLEVRAAALTETGTPAPDLPLAATIRQGDTTLPLRLTPGPDGWSGQTAPLAPGDWHLTVTGDDRSANARGTIAYPASLDHSRADPGLITTLSAITGGRRLAADDDFPWPGLALQLAPGWPLWALLALAAFLLDLGVRYVPGLFFGLRRALRPTSTRRRPA